MKKIVLMLVFLSFFCFLNLVWGDEIDLKEIKKFAERGHVDAQLTLGSMYLSDKSSSQNYTEAMKWYRKAANQEVSEAQFFLGVMYYRGQGVSKNLTEATKWFKKAAERGNAEAQLFLNVIKDMQNKSKKKIASSQISKKPEKKEVQKTDLNISQGRVLLDKYTVYLHFFSEKNKKLMETLAVILENKGFAVNGIERVNYFNRDIRYFHSEDKPAALLLKKYVTQFITIYTHSNNIDIKTFNLSHKYPNVKKGAIELWLKL